MSIPTSARRGLGSTGDSDAFGLHPHNEVSPQAQTVQDGEGADGSFGLTADGLSLQCRRLTEWSQASGTGGCLAIHRSQSQENAPCLPKAALSRAAPLAMNSTEEEIAKARHR